MVMDTAEIFPYDKFMEAIKLDWNVDELMQVIETFKYYGDRVMSVSEYRIFGWRRSWYQHHRANSLPPEVGPVHIYADGSGTTANKDAGIGTVVIRNSTVTIVGDWIGQGTNNVAELTAIYRGLQEIPCRDADITIHSDSQYALGSLSQDWKIKANKDLILEIRVDLERRSNVQYKHVRGHNGDMWQEICDQLAHMGRTGHRPIYEVIPNSEVIPVLKDRYGLRLY